MIHINSFLPRFLKLIINIFKGKNNTFVDSKTYWNNRYSHDGTSGDGSYGFEASYKSKYINSFLTKNEVNSVVEFGCGDGNQLRGINYSNYLGVDISKDIIELCKYKYKKDETKQFILLEHFKEAQFDLSLSLDVIYHLVEDENFYQHINKVFISSSKYVIIFSTNFDDLMYNFSHVRNRKFTDYIEENFSDFELIDTDINKNKNRASFYVYKKRLSHQ